MKLTAISKRILDNHKKKKEELKEYEKKLTKQKEELRLGLAPQIYEYVLNKNIRHSTP